MSGDVWSEDQDRMLWRLWTQAEPYLSAEKIGRIMKRSKNSIVGRAHRLGCPPRPSPITRDAWSDAEMALFHAFWFGGGMGWEEITRRLHRAQDSLRNKARHLGWPPLGAEKNRVPSRTKQTKPAAPPPQRARSALPAKQVQPAAAKPRARPIEPASPHPGEKMHIVSNWPCSWPTGDPGEPGYRTCDQPALPGYSYCANCCRLAYVGFRPPGKKAARL